MMKAVTAFCFAAAVAAAVLFCFCGGGIYLTLAITFGTTCYHLGIRLLVGQLYDLGMGNRADYTKKWFQPRPWEDRLYRALKVKAWKGKMPTFYPEVFSCEKHSWDEIAQAMCQSELVHETNALLSFLPVITARWFGAFPVFLATSVCGAVFDLMLVAMQRYNRARIMRIMSRKAGAGGQGSEAAGLSL